MIPNGTTTGALAPASVVSESSQGPAGRARSSSEQAVGDSYNADSNPKHNRFSYYSSSQDLAPAR